jgi:hypothetical protein
MDSGYPAPEKAALLYILRIAGEGGYPSIIMGRTL